MINPLERHIVSSNVNCSLPEPVTIIASTVCSAEVLPPHILEAAHLLQLGQPKKAITTLNNSATPVPELVWGGLLQ